MGAAEEACEAARRLIAEAKAAGAERLDLDRPETHALETLPPEIGTLTARQDLSHDNTQVGDAGLAALAPLTALQFLSLSNTQVGDLSALAERAWTDLDLSGSKVRDLRPIRGMKSLTGGRIGGLRFRGIPACDLDPKLKVLSEIDDDQERTRKTLDYLDEVGDDWPPVPELAEVPEEQSRAGMPLTTDEAGRIAHDMAPSGVAGPDRVAQFHAILTEEVADFLRPCPPGHNVYGRLGERLERYRRALGETPERIVAHLLWKAGNDLRILLRGNADRFANYVDGMPKLDPDFHDALAAMVASHNVLADAHPEIAALDHAAEDAAERQRAEANRETMAAMLAAVEAQVALIVEEVRRDLRDLHKEARGEGQTALRALAIEDETFRNLIRIAVAEAVAESKGERKGVLRVLAGDARGGVVGGAAGAAAATAAAALGPAAAAGYVELVGLLQPYIAAYLADWPTEAKALKQAVEYIVTRWELNRVKTPPRGSLPSPEII